MPPSTTCSHTMSAAASAGSCNLRPGDGGGSFDHLAEPGVGGVPVPPGDVAADHAGLLAVGRVIGAVEGEVAQGGELRLDAVEPGAVERGVGELDVGRRRPAADPVIAAGGQVRAEVVADDRQAHLGRVERAQVAAEGQELGAALTPGDVSVELVA